MADIHITTRARRARDYVVAALVAADSLLHGQLFAGAAIVLVAYGLRAGGVDLQYIAGAFIVVYAQTLSRKRFNRDVSITAPDPAPIRQSFPTGSETEKLFGGKRDPIADALDR